MKLITFSIQHIPCYHVRHSIQPGSWVYVLFYPPHFTILIFNCLIYRFAPGLSNKCLIEAFGYASFHSTNILHIQSHINGEKQNQKYVRQSTSVPILYKINVFVEVSQLNLLMIHDPPVLYFIGGIGQGLDLNVHYILVGAYSDLPDPIHTVCVPCFLQK